MNKFQNKYRIPSARLQGYDYGSNGMYYVTICTKDRLPYFGKIVSIVGTDNYPSLQTTEIGKIAITYWQEIPRHFPFVELDKFVVMPNHIHGILFFNQTDKINLIPNKFGGQSRNLGSVLRGFKASLKRYANQNNIQFEWQSRYHDRIIRNLDELNRIRIYISNNPINWTNDEMNKSIDTLPTVVETDNYPSLPIHQ